MSGSGGSSGPGAGTNRRRDANWPQDQRTGAPPPTPVLAFWAECAVPPRTANLPGHGIVAAVAPQVIWAACPPLFQGSLRNSPEDQEMAEISREAVDLEQVEARVQALIRLAPKGPPSWANTDLTFGQLRLLFTLSQSGPVSIGQLADRLGVADATASEFVDRLERRGLATRSHRADDRRVVECGVSEQGAMLLSEIAGARREALRRVLALLTQEELADFDRLVRVVSVRLAAAASDAGPKPNR
jgi:DNA-binding MarR family transcriptional regulator